MSKTYDNCIWLEDSAKDMYGKDFEDRRPPDYHVHGVLHGYSDGGDREDRKQ